MRRSVPLLVATAIALLAQRGAAQALPAVFAGDPVDGAGRPWVMLPGVPLVQPGPDGKWGTGDDLLDLGLLGDVDVVVRAGTYAPGSGVIPPPAAGVAAAPAVVAGGATLLAGAAAPVQLVVSDGASPPETGNPLTASDLDGRGALFLAYADLDGDGFLGPTSADAAGSADDAVERQEALTPVGRRLAVVSGGLASAEIAVESGLPASAGGLGVVLVGGAITGASSPLYLDGAWVATLLPCMWPPDATLVVGRNPGPPDPSALVDIEVERENLFCPDPDHPLLGTPFAIPLDGSSISNDLLRAESGPAASVGLAVPVDVATFVAAPERRLLPVVGAGGARSVVEPTTKLVLADDGPGGAKADLVVFPADVLGNQADVPFGGASITVRVSPNLQIASPDADGDPQRETLAFAAADVATVALDDAGGAGDAASEGWVVASLDGVAPVAARVLFGAGSAAALDSAKATLRRGRTPSTDRVTLVATIDAGAFAPDVAAGEVAMALRERGETLFARSIPGSALTANPSRTVFRYRDPTPVALGRVTGLSLRKSRTANRYVLRLTVKALDASRVAADRALAVEIAVGGAAASGELPCRTNRAGTTHTCAP